MGVLYWERTYHERILVPFSWIVGNAMTSSCSLLDSVGVAVDEREEQRKPSGAAVLLGTSAAV